MSRLGVALVFVVGCGGTTPTLGSPDCAACDLDVDYAALQRPSPSPSPSTSPSPSPSASTRALYAPTRRYRGRKIDLDFKNVDIHDVFRALAQVGGTNIVIADEVKGRVTIALRRVPWDQALATVVAVKQLSMIHRDGVYLIMSKR